MLGLLLGLYLTRPSLSESPMARFTRMVAVHLGEVMLYRGGYRHGWKLPRLQHLVKARRAPLVYVRSISWSWP
jgi:hypothetical protein